MEPFTLAANREGFFVAWKPGAMALDPKKAGEYFQKANAGK